MTLEASESQEEIHQALPTPGDPWTEVSEVTEVTEDEMSETAHQHHRRRTDEILLTQEVLLKGHSHLPRSTAGTPGYEFVTADEKPCLISIVLLFARFAIDTVTKGANCGFVLASACHSGRDLGRSYIQSSVQSVPSMPTRPPVPAPPAALPGPLQDVQVVEGSKSLQHYYALQVVVK